MACFRLAGKLWLYSGVTTQKASDSASFVPSLSTAPSRGWSNGASATGNPFGAYFAAYVSTALVIYGLIDLARKMRAHRSLSRTLPILITGILTGVFMNMAQVLGWSVYLAFIIGQLFTHHCGFERGRSGASTWVELAMHSMASCAA